MANNHYETLGVPPNATPSQIRATYRRLVMKHHPDQAGNAEIFIAITQAYEVLSDPDRRKEYDRLLDLRNRPPETAPAPKKAPEPSRPAARPGPSRPSPTMAADLDRLVKLYGRGAFFEAEKVAKHILAQDNRQATPYAILGDLARNRGNLEEAARMYAYAIQFEPRNAAYQRKHEELLNRIHLSPGKDSRTREQVGLGPGIAFAMIPIACAYIALAREPKPLESLPWISSWTLGLVVMMFLGGVAFGVGMSMAGFLDRLRALSSNALNQISPALALASIAIVNFWAAALIFAMVGLRNRATVYSISRLFVGAACVLGLFAMAAAASKHIQPEQVLLWGGNVVYVGAVCGWMVADSLRD